MMIGFLRHEQHHKEKPPSGSRPFWRASGEGGPQKLAVPARCGIHQRAFLLLMQRDAKETWNVMFAVPAPPDTGDVTRVSSGALS